MQPNRVSQWFEEETTRNVAPAVSASPSLAGFAPCDPAGEASATITTTDV